METNPGLPAASQVQGFVPVYGERWLQGGWELLKHPLLAEKEGPWRNGGPNVSPWSYGPDVLWGQCMESWPFLHFLEAMERETEPSHWPLLCKGGATGLWDFGSRTSPAWRGLWRQLKQKWLCLWWWKEQLDYYEELGLKVFASLVVGWLQESCWMNTLPNAFLYVHPPWMIWVSVEVCECQGQNSCARCLRIRDELVTLIGENRMSVSG